MTNVESVKFAATLRAHNGRGTLQITIPAHVKKALNLRADQQIILTAEASDLGVKYKE